MNRLHRLFHRHRPVGPPQTRRFENPDGPGYLLKKVEECRCGAQRIVGHRTIPTVGTWGRFE
jgi:hypothetical protein